MTLRNPTPSSEHISTEGLDEAPGIPEIAQTLEFVGLDHQPPANAPRAIPSLASGTLDNNPLRHVRTRLTVCVGSAELTVGELLSAREEQVLRLDQLVEQPVDLLLEGQVVARGMLVAVGEHFGVRLTELPKPLAP
jgi:flagellar motor switch protein FliN/FliY